MRIMHIGKYWPPYAGGIERAARELCVRLAHGGIDVTALAHATPRAWRGTQLSDDNVDVHLAACLGQLAYTPVSPAFGLDLDRCIKARQPQLLHMHLPNPAAFWGLALPSARRLPWVLHWHADIPLVGAPGLVRHLYPFYRPLENALLRRARAVICTSPEYRDASDPLQIWRDKCRVIPLGVPAAPTVPLETRKRVRRLWPGEGLRLLAVGRLSHYKGFDVLLRAMAEVKDIQLLLIGDGECAADLRRQRAELGLEGRVHLAGAVDDATRDAACAEAELFCLPSLARSEAFGVVLLEAMRAGLPVVASAVPGSGMLHVLDHGEAGALVPPGDAAALAATLRGLAADPTQREQLARAGERRWRQHFTLDGSADAVSQLYRRVLADADP